MVLPYRTYCAALRRAYRLHRKPAGTRTKYRVRREIVKKYTGFYNIKMDSYVTTYVYYRIKEHEFVLCLDKSKFCNVRPVALRGSFPQRDTLYEYTRITLERF